MQNFKYVDDFRLENIEILNVINKSLDCQEYLNKYDAIKYF
jgi:hypothetical protein